MTRREILALLTGVALTGCAAAGFPYYGLSTPEVCYQQSMLLAADPKNDLPFSICKPDAANKLKCPIMLKADFDALIVAKAKCEQDLVACEQRQ